MTIQQSVGLVPALLVAVALGGCGSSGSSEPTTPGEQPTTESPESPSEGGDPDNPDVDPGGPVLSSNEFVLYEVIPPRGVTEGGEVIAFVGAQFAEGMAVYFGDVEAAAIFLSSPQVAGVTTPPGVLGTVDVRIVSADGEESILPNAFQYYEPFGVESVAPDKGPLEGGTSIEITGYGLKDDATVLVGDRLAIGQVRTSETTIEAITPPGDGPGPASVSVVTSAGKFTLDGAYTYTAELGVESVDPFAGSVSGGEVVTIRGEGFDETTYFEFGGILAAVVEVGSDGLAADVVVPPGPLGTVEVRAIRGDETAVANPGFFYVDPEQLEGETEILAVQPDNGPTTGGEFVSIVAVGLDTFADARVYFGGVEANVASLTKDVGLVTVVLPENTAGAVDLELSTFNGSDVWEDGFTYFAEPTVISVSPNAGPAEGGTDIVIEGVGFDAATSVRIGALPAENWTAVSDTRIEATTPAGSPGYADIIVNTEVGKAVLDDGFTYEAGVLRVLALDPSEGPLSGKTQIKILGTDFPSASRVFFDDVEVLDAAVVSPTEIKATTPGWLSPATVDVKVQHAGSTESDTLISGFTYFNPSASGGGTWGPPVQGTLNVSVVDIWTEQGIEDAFVILWTEAETPYQGYTDFLGTLTFNGADLEGVQMVSAWAPGYSASSIVEFDSENVTVLLFPESPPAAGGGGGGGGAIFEPPPVIQGRAIINEKYLIPPPGTCGGTFTDPIDGEVQGPEDLICQPCVELADCLPADWAPEVGEDGELVEGSPGAQCTEFFDGEKFCTTDCESGSDCPSGYACLNISTGTPAQCIPVSGQIRILCQLSTADAFSSPPGGQVLADTITGEFEITVTAGEWAVICQAELYDPETGESTPISVGAAFPVSANNGEITTGVEVPMDVPLNRDVDITMDYPPSKLLSMPNHQLRALLQFGEYGFHELRRAAVEPGTSVVTLERMPQGTTGSLEGAGWMVMGGAYSAVSNFVNWIPPYSTAILRGLPTLGDSHLLSATLNGQWAAEDAPFTPLGDLWSPGDGTVFAAGATGEIYKRTSAGWSLNGKPSDAEWRSMWGTGPEFAAVVGDSGRVAFYNGSVWVLNQTLSFDTFAVGGTAADDVVVAGSGGEIWVYDGTTWMPDPAADELTLTATVRDADSDPVSGAVWLVGDEGTVVLREAGEAIEIDTPFEDDLLAVAIAPNGSVFAGGRFGTLWRYAESGWTPLATNTSKDIHGLWVAPSGIVWAVGERGLVLSVAPNGTVTDYTIPKAGMEIRAAWGSGNSVELVAGQDAVLLGPLMEVPTFLPPLSNGVIGEDDVVSWSAPGGALPDFNYAVLGQPWWSPDWQFVTEGSVESVKLPDLESLVNFDQLSGNSIYLELNRGRIDGFDIDNFEYFNMFFRELLWDAWSVNFTYFNAN